MSYSNKEKTCDVDIPFETDEAIRFYDQIAHLHDDRNTFPMRASHQAIVEKLFCLLPKKNTAIDFGCGTGIVISQCIKHFEHVNWLAIDGSPSMISLLKSKILGKSQLVNVLQSDLLNINWASIVEADLCVSSFMLSSMPSSGIICDIAKKVKPGGHLIVADIHPEKTKSSPFYKFKIEASCSITFKPSPVCFKRLSKHIHTEGLILLEQQIIVDSRDNPYSFISLFHRPLVCSH